LYYFDIDLIFQVKTSLGGDYLETVTLRPFPDWIFTFPFIYLPFFNKIQSPHNVI